MPRRSNPSRDVNIGAAFAAHRAKIAAEAFEDSIWKDIPRPPPQLHDPAIAALVVGTSHSARSGLEFIGDKILYVIGDMSVNTLVPDRPDLHAIILTAATRNSSLGELMVAWGKHRRTSGKGGGDTMETLTGAYIKDGERRGLHDFIKIMLEVFRKPVLECAARLVADELMPQTAKSSTPAGPDGRRDSSKSATNHKRKHPADEAMKPAQVVDTSGDSGNHRHKRSRNAIASSSSAPPGPRPGKRNREETGSNQTVDAGEDKHRNKRSRSSASASFAAAPSSAFSFSSPFAPSLANMSSSIFSPSFPASSSYSGTSASASRPPAFSSPFHPAVTTAPPTVSSTVSAPQDPNPRSSSFSVSRSVTHPHIYTTGSASKLDQLLAMLSMDDLPSSNPPAAPVPNRTGPLADVTNRSLARGTASAKKAS
ncbi:hypothetical protein C8R46DRAFT_1207047 [Mycena filopes]|nr:hypothetical protein C8R46DRAFT_1207047 [Mycena filopes]